jgi:hypothetical protein
MELGYQDFPEDGVRVRASLLPLDGDRFSRAQKLYRIGGVTAALVGAFAVIGLLASPAAKLDEQVAANVAPAPAASVNTQLMTRWGVGPSDALAVAAPTTKNLAAASSASAKISRNGGSEVFDKAGRFIMKDFDRAKPMASFLPGVGGKWGVPMWAFYVNRGQGMATFGVENKDGGILLFQTAEKTYQVTPYVGFRTLLKGTRQDGTTFEAQPFMPSGDADPQATPARKMFIGNNEMEVQESDPATGIRTNALYFTTVDEPFPAMVRRVTFTNEGAAAVVLEVADGLAKLEPHGAPMMQIAGMGRTLEGWMQVYNFNATHLSAPFFHLVSAPADTADVTLIKEGHFALAFVEEEATVDARGEHALLPMICDQQLLFGTDTTLSVPRAFFASAAAPAGASLSQILAQGQSTTSRTPSAFAAAKLSLQPGESKTIALVIGHAKTQEQFVTDIAPRLRKQGYIAKMRLAAQQAGTDLTERVAMSSGVPAMDAYAKQNYLDNVLRGGMPLEMGATEKAGPKIYHTFSRIHGDLERDYNNFQLEQSVYSQGPGNFRDVNQNRRCDVLQMPSVYDFNIRQFLTYVQADGYNQMTVANAFFKIYDQYRVTEIVSQIVPPGPSQEVLTKLLSGPFRPGQLFKNITDRGIKIAADREHVLNLVTKYASQVPAGQYAQNGFWTDHFSYHLDLVWDFLAVFPDQKEYMLYDSEPIPFFLSPGRVLNRTEKNQLVSDDKIRQYDAVSSSPKKILQLQKIYSQPDFVGDTSSGGTFQLTAAGAPMRVTVMSKLVVLAANKFSILDPLGMGIEMEAGKPGWNDAMNGLPALFGSEMPSAYEVHEIVDFVGRTVDELGRDTEVPEEMSALLTSLGRQLDRLKAGTIEDFAYWDSVHDSLEDYRAATEATFSGTTVSWPAADLGKATGLFGKMLARMDQGIRRALSYAPDGGKKISPTYFIFTVTDYELAGQLSGRGLPTIQVKSYSEPEALPLFLEGPTRHLKTLKDAPKADAAAVYAAVAASALHDKELQMYKVSASLVGQPMEIGRMMAFTPGWLENESVWLHMSYKWYLELLRAGLYREFFKEILTGVVCFMDTKVSGRSPLEASSFIVSSAFPDKALHGSGFLARLSGTTAEFLSMWNHMMFGPTPFTTSEAGALQLALRPVIAQWMWRADGTLETKFLGTVDLTYSIKAAKDSWEVKVKGYELTKHDGAKVHVSGAVVGMPHALDIRNKKYAAIAVALE